MIRKITKDSFKELGDLLDGGQTQVPVFGYPLICYSPKAEEEDQAQRKRVVYEKFKHSLWKHLTKSIYTNVKEGQQLFIRDLLDSLDDVKDDFNDIYTKFTQGKSLVVP